MHVCARESEGGGVNKKGGKSGVGRERKRERDS